MYMDKCGRAELDAILQAHKKWLDTHEKEEGERAELHKADLSRADLSNKDLRDANFSEACLRRANLLGADLTGADVADADLRNANLSEARLQHTNLTGANLIAGGLAEADLSGAYLEKADLSQADLSGANLKGAHLTGVRLKGAIYEPVENPSPVDIAAAIDLANLTWKRNSQPIHMLWRSLSDSGFPYAARQVNAAIHRHAQTRLEYFLFDWTCEWGANSMRPVELVCVLCVICAFIYWVGMHFGRRSGLYLAATGQRITTGKGKERVLRIEVRRRLPTMSPDQLELDLVPPQRSKRLPQPFRRMFNRELVALGTAFLFSLMSVFNIGFREFNFGRWIRMLQPREFDIRPRGWMRSVSGIESLVGVALLALALLSYFGHPFD
jgi:hypothetical protein